MAARTPTNTTILQPINVSGANVSVNAKVVITDAVLDNNSTGCYQNKILLQGQ